MQEDRSPSDSALLAQYLAGDSGGAEALFGRYQPALFAYLLRRLGKRDLAEESVQETFCRLLERASRLSRHPRLKAWLFAVARNISADVRRRQRSRAAPFTELQGGGIEPLLEGPRGFGPHDQVESAELNRVLLGVISAMPAPEREVFLLRTQSTLSFKEISVFLGAPLNTVLSRMHRAMKRIRAALVATFPAFWPRGISPGGPSRGCDE